MSSTVIGRDVATRQELALGETARLSGLYILGKPGMGKSNLLETLIIADIRQGRGVFFLDPHGDAIDKIVQHLDSPPASLKILDPEEEAYSFGINPLACHPLTSLKARTEAYTKAYHVFYKLWEQDWGVWLQLIIQNTLYVFLENPAYTLAEVPLFFTDKSFRAELVHNVNYNLDVKDFWQVRFDSKREYDQQKQVDAALTRISTLLGHPYLKHIVGQQTTTLDFAQIMANREVVFLKLSASLAPDIKKFIGTIMIGELLQAVRNRPPGKRSPFGVFLDEVQHFATSDDLTTFITEARKFGVATTIAHQERLGQLGDNKKMLGATLAAANKVFFQLTVKDAEELATEFAQEPPVETRLEEQVVISQNPVFDLLKGHSHPEIRAFVDQYLRPLQERTEDIRNDIELARLVRDDYRDQAGIERILAQIVAPRSQFDDRSAQRATLRMAISSLLFARTQTEKLAAFLQSSQALRQTIRELNQFLTGVMEGRIQRGQEIFGQFLIAITRVQEFSLVPQEYAPLLELYLTLQYGDPNKAIAIPFALAQAHGFFSRAVAQLIQQREEKIQQENEAFFKERWETIRQLQAKEAEFHQLDQTQKTYDALAYLTRRVSNPDYSAKWWLSYYILLHMDKDVRQALEPYYTARLTPAWRDQHSININAIIQEFLEWIATERHLLNKARKYKDKYDNKWFTLRPTITGNYKLIDRRYQDILRSWTFKPGELTEGKDYQIRILLGYKLLPPLFPRRNIRYFFGSRGAKGEYLKPEAVYEGPYGPFFADFLLDDIQQWLTEYQEGAFIVLLLLRAVFFHGWPDLDKFYYPNKAEQYAGYPYNSSLLPAIANQEPLEVFLLLDKLCAIISRIRSFESKRQRYYWLADGRNPYINDDDDKDKTRDLLLIHQSKNPEGISQELSRGRSMGWFNQQLQENRFFERLRAEGHHSWWFALKEVAQLYLKRRARDLVYYGKEVAALTFPQPTVPGATARQVAELVDSMVATSLIKQQEREQKWLNEWQQSIQQRYESQKACLPMPEVVPPQVLTAADIEAVKKACLSELSRPNPAWDGKKALSAIADFVQFCTLLSKPENHIKVRTGQYVEKQVYTRSAADMKAAMAQALASLPRYVAWAKVLDPFDEVLKHKIKTVSVEESYDINPNHRDNRDLILAQTRESCCTPRDRIEAEILARQTQWKKASSSPDAENVIVKRATARPGQPPPGRSPV